MTRKLSRVAIAISLLLSMASSQDKSNAAVASKPVAAPVQSPFAPFTHFSATMTGGLLKDEPRKIYRSGNLLRVDLDNKFHVTDLIHNSTWAVHPERCTHVGSPDIRSYPFSVLNKYKVERQRTTEKEIIDGHPCRIENATLTAPDDRPPIKMKLWEAEDLQGFPVRMEITSRVRTITIAYSDVKLVPPDPSLFKLPAKCPYFHPNVKIRSEKPAAKPSKTPAKPKP